MQEDFRLQNYLILHKTYMVKKKLWEVKKQRK